MGQQWFFRSCCLALTASKTKIKCLSDQPDSKNLWSGSRCVEFEPVLFSFVLKTYGLSCALLILRKFISLKIVKHYGLIGIRLEMSDVSYPEYFTIPACSAGFCISIFFWIYLSDSLPLDIE